MAPRSTSFEEEKRWNHCLFGPNDAADSLNLYDVSGIAHYELYHALTQAGNPSGLEATKACGALRL